MKREEAEAKFEEYRESLISEAIRLTSYIRVHRRLYERREDRLNEMNMFPAFFRTVVDALFSAIVIWVDKLLGERSERGLVNFLIFVENNREIFEIKELQRRRKYPDGHWMLNREPITLEVIQDDRNQLRNFAPLASFKLRRDKFHAHFDKKYFFERDKLSEDAPLILSDLDEVVTHMKNTIDRYSTSYDGNVFDLELMDISDIDYLLDFLYEHEYRENS